MPRPGSFQFTALDPATRTYKDWIVDVCDGMIRVREKGHAAVDGHLYAVQLVELARLNRIGVLRTRMEDLRRSLAAGARKVAAL